MIQSARPLIGEEAYEQALITINEFAVDCRWANIRIANSHSSCGVKPDDASIIDGSLLDEVACRGDVPQLQYRCTGGYIPLQGEELPSPASRIMEGVHVAIAGRSLLDDSGDMLDPSTYFDLSSWNGYPGLPGIDVLNDHEEGNQLSMSCDTGPWNAPDVTAHLDRSGIIRGDLQDVVAPRTVYALRSRSCAIDFADVDEGSSHRSWGVSSSGGSLPSLVIVDSSPRDSAVILGVSTNCGFVGALADACNRKDEGEFLDSSVHDFQDSVDFDFAESVRSTGSSVMGCLG